MNEGKDIYKLKFKITNLPKENLRVEIKELKGEKEIEKVLFAKNQFKNSIELFFCHDDHHPFILTTKHQSEIFQ